MKNYSEVISEIINNKKLENADEFVKSKFFRCGENISRERYIIENDIQSEYYKKEIGRYELLSIPEPLDLRQDEEETIALELMKMLKSLLGKITKKSRILIVGLGNRHISADSLGTAICKKINITLGMGNCPEVMAICPSVLGLTGIESYDIVKGVVDRVNPTHLILIDSLCAGSEERLCKSIQMSNTGVCPGSGIGNKRKCLDISLAENVVSIGVPLLIYADTFLINNLSKNKISKDRISSIMQKIKKIEDNTEIIGFINDIKNIVNYSNNHTVVTVKDIEECVEKLSKIISRAINMTLCHKMADLK